MAREKKFQSIFQSDSSVYYRLEIYDNEATDNTLHEPVLSSRGFDLTYQTEDENRFTGLIPSELVFDMLITSNAQQALINEIKTSVYGRWQIGVYRSDDDSTYTLFWCGNLLNDISPEQDVAYPREFSLTAVCGLSPLKDIKFNEGVGYTEPSTFTALQYFRNAFTLQINTDTFFTGSSPFGRFIRTFVDWTTDNMTHQADRDPLVYSRFNFMAFVELDDDGAKKYATTFDLLDSICKTFGMRVFFSNGNWIFVQVNYYDNWTSGNTHFFRAYNIGNDVTGSPDSSGSTSAVVSEGSTYKRLGGATFDFLPVLKEVNANYDRLQTFNMPFLQYSNNSDTSTLFNPNFNEIPLWNGYKYNDIPFSGTGFDINNSKTDLYSVSLGSVIATTSSTIRFNRTFKCEGLDTGFSPSSGAFNNLEIRLSLRFRLVGASDTKYAFIREGNEEWHDIDVDFASSGVFDNVNLSSTLTNNFSLNINCETFNLPFDGDLFLDGYAAIYYNNNTAVPIQVLEGTTDSDNILCFSEPVFNQQGGVQYLVNGELSNLEFYRAKNAPGGTAISTGVIYNVPDLLVGSSPNGIGRIEVYNFSTSAFEAFNTTWKAFNSGTGTRITQLLVEQILKGQNKGARTFNGSIKITDKSLLPYYFGITIDGSNFVPYQCTFNAQEDTWSGEWYEISLNSTGQTISSGTINGLQADDDYDHTNASL
jgi:hypothetical protein